MQSRLLSLVWGFIDEVFSYVRAMSRLASLRDSSTSSAVMALSIDLAPRLPPGFETTHLALWSCVGLLTYFLFTVSLYASQKLRPCSKIADWGQIGDALYTSPIRNVPGPFLNRISKVPLLWAVWKTQRSRYCHELLREYGPVVVIAPNQVHTNDDSTMKAIYDRTSQKTRFYDGMGSWKGVKGTLGFRTYKEAAPTRNNLLQCFQNRNLTMLVENIQAHCDQFVSVLRPISQAGNVFEGHVLFRLLALDVVTDVLWGEEEKLLDDVSDGSAVFLRRFFAFSRWNAFKSFMPGADFFVKYFGSRGWKQLRNDCNDLDTTARLALHRWETSEERQRHVRDVLSMLKSMETTEDPLKRMPPGHIIAYMVEMLVAGSATTSLTAAAMGWVLARNPAAQKKLRQEIFASFPQADNIELGGTLELPYLDAVIKETMRRWPPIPGPLERHLGQPINVNGRVIPSGVIASTAAADQGFLEDVFPDPESWIPERWLNATERMNANWIPFGTGCRACPGQNLAMTELKYIAVVVYRHFRSIVPAGHEGDRLELSDIFAAGIVDKHCWLQFEVAEDRP